MKKISVFILMIISSCVITPKFIGSVVETEHQLLLDKLNKNPAITVNSTSFTRQWFTGSAKTEMTLVLKSEGKESITVIVEENLKFGPVILTNNGLEIGLSYSQAEFKFNGLIIDEEIESFINDKVHFSGLLTFSKNIISTIVVDAVSKEIDDNNINSEKAIGNFTIEDSNRIYGNFNWAGLTAKTNEKTINIGPIAFTLDQTLTAGDYFQGNAISAGDFNFKIASLIIKNNIGETELSFENLLITALSTLDNNLMTIVMNYQADNIETTGQRLDNANVDIMLSRVNVNVMQEINTLLAELSTNSKGVLFSEKMIRLSELVEQLLLDDPVINIKDLSAKTSEGNIETTLKISTDAKLFDPKNVMSIVPAIKANANGKAPLTFFTKLGLAPMVDLYIKEGFVIKKGNELSVNIQFSQGKLSINGKVISI